MESHGDDVLDMDGDLDGVVLTGSLVYDAPEDNEFDVVGPCRSVPSIVTPRRGSNTFHLLLVEYYLIV
jgi:hypothetical protein